MDMNLYNEIGGYFNLDCKNANFLHSDGLLLNSATNALKLIIEHFSIKKLAVPFYTCPSVWKAIEMGGCEATGYDIDDDFLPLFYERIPIIYTNYFGLCDHIADDIKKRFPFVIIDNAQSFYSAPTGDAAVYSPRKFFGVPDGGILFPALAVKNLEKSISWQRASYLLKRLDEGAQAAYTDFKKSESSLEQEKPKLMSNLTMGLLANIDYDTIAEKRKKNFNILHAALKEANMLKLLTPMDSAPLVYPFRTKIPHLREKLIKHKIFAATYWLGDESKCMTSPQAMLFSREIIPLPIDQRYDETAMHKILDVIHEQN